jgi:hypothetical protein
MRWMRRPFALQTDHLLWHNFGHMAVWDEELSKCNCKLLRAISADFVECSWRNGFNILSMKDYATTRSHSGRISTIAKPFGLKKLLTLISRPDHLVNRVWELLVQTQLASWWKFFHNIMDSSPV